MARFSSSEELENVLGSFFERVTKTPQAHLIHQVGGVIRFIYHRPETSIEWVPTPQEAIPFSVHCGPGGPDPLLVFEQDGDTAHRFWQGTLNLQDALSRQLVRARGPLSRAMKLIPHLDEIYPLYVAYLEESGREGWIMPGAKS